MKAKVVSIDEIKKDNPNLCLSPLRVFAECHKCPVYKRAMKKGTIGEDGFIYQDGYGKDKKRKLPKCNPQIKPEVKALFKQRAEVIKRLEWVDEALKSGKISL